MDCYSGGGQSASRALLSFGKSVLYRRRCHSRKCLIGHPHLVYKHALIDAVNKVRSPEVGRREPMTHFHRDERALLPALKDVRRRGRPAGSRTVGEIFGQNECSR
jgi:hypothetical protein